MHNIEQSFYESCLKSDHAFGYHKLFYPDSESVFSEMINRNINIQIILTEELLDKIRTCQSKSFSKFLKSGYLKLYMCPKKIDLMYIAFNDRQLHMHLLKSDMTYDSKYIFTSDPEALQWGKDLFDYFVKESVPVTEL